MLDIQDYMTGADLTCLTSRTQGGYRTADDKLYASMSEDADVEDANKAEVLRVRIQFEHRANVCEKPGHLDCFLPPAPPTSAT